MTPFPKQASCRTHRESGERLKAFTFERSTRSEASAGSGAGGDAPTKCGPQGLREKFPQGRAPQQLLAKGARGS